MSLTQLLHFKLNFGASNTCLKSVTITSVSNMTYRTHEKFPCFIDKQQLKKYLPFFFREGEGASKYTWRYNTNPARFYIKQIIQAHAHVHTSHILLELGNRSNQIDPFKKRTNFASTLNSIYLLKFKKQRVHHLNRQLVTTSGQNQSSTNWVRLPLNFGPVPHVRKNFANLNTTSNVFIAPRNVRAHFLVAKNNKKNTHLPTSTNFNQLLPNFNQLFQNIPKKSPSKRVLYIYI